jgi:hypothetical protein
MGALINRHDELRVDDNLLGTDVFRVHRASKLPTRRHVDEATRSWMWKDDAPGKGT